MIKGFMFQAIILSFTINNLFAQAGALDTTFSGDGYESISFGDYDWGWAVNIQPDDKILISGSTSNPSSVSLARFNSDGSLDNSYGVNGKVITNAGNLYLNIRSAALQQDGKLVVGGLAGDPNTDFLFIRYKQDGDIDSSFGLNGMAIKNHGCCDEVTALCIQPDGKILAAGLFKDIDYDLGMIRLTEEGNLDSSFASSGMAITVHSGMQDHPSAIALQPDGKIIIAGSFCSSTCHLVMLRYNTDGTPDSTFGSLGKATTNTGVPDWATSLVVQPDGKIVVAGTVWNGTSDDILISRFNSNGSVDTLFGSAGIVISDPGGEFDQGNSVVLQEDGKIVVAGRANPNYYEDVCLIRYNGDGSYDNTFGTNGMVIKSLYQNDNVNAIAIQSDGKLVVGGGTIFSGGSDFIISRFLASCEQFIFYADADSDTFGNADDTIAACAVPLGYAENNLDCEDLNSAVYPGAPEITNGIDDDCDGLTDEICSAYFTLIPDSLIPHHYWAINLAAGVPPLSFTWSWGDGEYDSVAYPSHTYDSAGFYTICMSVQDAMGCESSYCNEYDIQKSSFAQTIIIVDVVDSVPATPTALPTMNILKSWSIYFDPSSEGIFVYYSLSSPATVGMELYDVLGNKVTQVTKHKDSVEDYSKLDAKALPAGIYLLHIRVNDENASKKIVVIR